MTCAPASARSCGADHCITCADEAVAMVVVRVDVERGLALCADQAGAWCSVETALVDSVTPGDRLLVHAGTAIAPAPEEVAP